MFPAAGSFPSFLYWLQLGWAKARSWNLNPGLPAILAIHALLHPRVGIGRQLESEAEQVL